MTSSAFSLKHKETTFSKPLMKGDDPRLAADLVHELCYLAAVAAAGIPRSQMFQLASKLPNTAAPYFAQVDNIARSMNYQYSDACTVVAESTKNEDVKGLLLRLSGALSSGEPESDFLAREAQIQAEAYGNIYEGKLETLKKWTDAYSAMVVSAVLIVVIATVSTVIYDLGMTVVLGLVGVTVMIMGLGAWVIYAAAPRETKVLQGPEGKESQRLPRILLLTLGPGSLAVAAVALAVGYETGQAMILAAACLVPVGWVCLRHDSKLTKYEADFNTFLRMLGATSSAIGTTPTEAMSRIDFRSAPSLMPAIKRLRLRLLTRASPELCWHRFVVECGSDLIARTVQVFLDGVRLGGDPEEVSARASILATKITYLRAKRKLVASTFAWLSVVLHASTVFLLVFVVKIVSGFGALVQKGGMTAAATNSASGGSGISVPTAFSFSFGNMVLLEALLVPIVIGLSIINAVTPMLADGGYVHKIFLYLSATTLASGLAMVLAPQITGAIYGIAASF